MISKEECTNLEKNIKYFHYGKLGHKKRKCRKSKKEPSRKKDEDNDTAIVTSNIDVVIICENDYVNLTCYDCT